jgi:hypothetical protein
MVLVSLCISGWRMLKPMPVAGLRENLKNHQIVSKTIITQEQKLAFMAGNAMIRAYEIQNHPA